MDKDIKKSIKFSNYLISLFKLEDFELKIIKQFIEDELNDRSLKNNNENIEGSI
jgi:hypothetical protein